MSRALTAPGRRKTTRAIDHPETTASRPRVRTEVTPLRAAKDEVVRRHILEAAEEVFAESGFTETKMQAIARRARISSATLYQNYPSKQQLYRAVLIGRDREMMAEVLRTPAIAAHQPISVLPLLSMMRGHLGFLLKHPNYLRMILQEGHAWYHTAAQPTDEEKALWAQGLAQLTAVFEHGARAGELLPGEPSSHARLLMAMQQARMASWVEDGMREAHDEVIAQIQADFVRTFCRPSLAARLLTEDGSSLRPATRKEMASLADGHPSSP
ncbi:MAG: TetR/AcrR family transcriptional regulator [Sinimarinibacterium flocculans]|uniref:TetR/AcrR family transcriptional regulator n=1 Tax=Sinimarinibacterium flocculans TaxID=985250 RepID=UPI003C6A9136